jgi:hypothetical protein
MQFEYLYVLFVGHGVKVCTEIVLDKVVRIYGKAWESWGK